VSASCIRDNHAVFPARRKANSLLFFGGKTAGKKCPADMQPRLPLPGEKPRT